MAADPGDCPRDAPGFDFDGASFSHVGAKVSFEVLLTTLELEQPALKRLGALAHFLDADGVEPHPKRAARSASWSAGAKRMPTTTS